MSEGVVDPDDVIVDDRTTMTIGKRLLNARRLGIPIVIVGGRASAESVPKFEVFLGTENDGVLVTALEAKHLCQRTLRRSDC